MGNDIATVQKTKAKATKLLRISDAAEMFCVDKRTIRKIAQSCGAYHPINRAIVFIDTELVEEFIRSTR